MTRTALQEHYGGSIEVNITGDYPIGLPSGDGGTRFYAIAPNVAGHDVYLPDARLLRPGGDPQFVILNEGANSFTIVDAAAGSVKLVASSKSIECLLLDNSTAAGSWVTVERDMVFGTPLTIGRIPFVWRYSSNATNVNLVTRAIAEGYDGVTPATVHVTIDAGVVISGAGGLPAMESGSWAAGSTLMLVLGTDASIAGHGGNGGHGAGTTSRTVGSAGGPALIVRLDTALVSYGFIQGGGGGGGGASLSGLWIVTPGGGGGGGAGLVPSIGGFGGGGITGDGQGGLLSIRGNGGTHGRHRGGAGGMPGNAGEQGEPLFPYGLGGALGGATGNAIETVSCTLTKIRAGTILGPEI